MDIGYNQPSRPIFDANTHIIVRSIFVGQRINLKAFDGAKVLATNPLVVNAGSEGYAVLFRYGAIVLLNLDPLEEIAFLESLKLLVVDPFEKPESENTEILVDPSQPEQIGEKYIRLKESTVEYIQVLADVLAKSVTLSYYETNIAQIFDRIEPMAAELSSKGRSTGRKTREYLSHIGQALLVQSKMIGRVQVEEKPDLLWERPDLERFYLHLESEYELPERLGILKHKLDLIHQTAETMLGLLQDKRTLHLEWYVVILIVFELALSIFDKVWHH